jgi:hypothetical protein
MPSHCCDDIDLLGDLDCVIGLAFATISTPASVHRGRGIE